MHIEQCHRGDLNHGTERRPTVPGASPSRPRSSRPTIKLTCRLRNSLVRSAGVQVRFKFSDGSCRADRAGGLAHLPSTADVGRPRQQGDRGCCGGLERGEIGAVAPSFEAGPQTMHRQAPFSIRPSRYHSVLTLNFALFDSAMPLMSSCGPPSTKFARCAIRRLRLYPCRPPPSRSSQRPNRRCTYAWRCRRSPDDEPSLWPGRDYEPIVGPGRPSTHIASMSSPLDRARRFA